jgi:Ca2+-binding EF-hand superfamily protein
MMDLDSNGLISIDEFKHACEMLSGETSTLTSFRSHLFSFFSTGYLPNCNVDQMLENCRMMDMNKDSHVDLNEFLEAFRLCQQFQGISSATELIPSKENSTRCLVKAATIVEEPERTENDGLDEYEISEMKECLNTGGQLRKSPSVRSVVSVDSLNQAGKTQEPPQENHVKKDKNEFDNV